VNRRGTNTALPRSRRYDAGAETRRSTTDKRLAMCGNDTPAIMAGTHSATPQAKQLSHRWIKPLDRERIPPHLDPVTNHFLRIFQHSGE
jgi:hypothetical protein